MMGKRSTFARVERDLYPTPYAAVATPCARARPVAAFIAARRSAPAHGSVRMPAANEPIAGG
jgi:hypothetical protein